MAPDQMSRPQHHVPISINIGDAPLSILPFIEAHNNGLNAIIRNAPIIYASIIFDPDTKLEELVNTVQCLYERMILNNESDLYFNKWVDVHYKLFCFLGGIEDAIYK